MITYADSYILMAEDLINTVCLRIVVSSTYYVVFCLSSSCVPCVAGFSALSIFDWPFGIL